MPMLSRSLVYRQQVGWQRMKNEIKLLIESLRLQLKAGPIRNTPRRAEAYSILPLPYMLRYLGKSFSHSTAEVCEALLLPLHKKWRWQKQLWAGQFPVFSQAQGYLIIFTSLGPHKRFGDNNESTRRQEYAKSGSIWDITYNLAHGTRVVRTRWRSTSSSSTSPCPVLWYIVRNSSHPQTSALEDKSGKQNHLRAQDVLPVHPVPTIWSRSSSTCKTAMVETCKPYFAKVLQSNSYTIITTFRFDDVWLTQGSFICPWRELTPW